MNDARADDTHDIAQSVNVLDTDDLSEVLRVEGYYKEKANHLEGAGVTYA